MAKDKITILGLYEADPNLFQYFLIPAELEKSALVNNILMECGNMEVMYPDADFMEKALGFWSQSRLHTWDRMFEVLYEDYDPFINIKRDEHRVITQTRDLHGTSQSSDSVAAWNESDPTERTRSEGSGSDTGTVITDETFHVEGDSAITDAQDVLKKEIEIRTAYDMYRIIADEFRKQFCLLVY